MDKMKMETPDLAQENFEKLAALFPNCVTERQTSNGGVLEKAIDFEKLRQMLADHVREGEEAYEFTWVGKKAAIVEANRPIRKTLRPCVEESKDWDTTQNLYIEGDNLEALKLLQESYLGKVKMIYIDPPYNTGNDFVYNDDFRQSFAEYEEDSGAVDEDGNRMKVNHETDGRFHSKWCSMIYSRLLIAKGLMSPTGVILINMDEHEIANLQKICSEIFGTQNELGVIVWDKRNPKGDASGISYQHEYIVAYAKDRVRLVEECPVRRPKKNAQKILEKARKLYKKVDTSYSLEEVNKEFSAWMRDQKEFSGGEKAYNKIDSDGNVYRPVSMAWPNKKKAPLDYFQPLIHPVTHKPCPVPEKGWRNPPSTMKKMMEEGRILFGKDENTIPNSKYLLKDNMYENIPSLLYYGGSDTDLLKSMKIPFDTPKVVGIEMEHLLSFMKQDDIVLDFFAGSSTTAHAVMQLNAEDGGKRKFIMIQIPETVDEKSEAYQAGYHTVCELGKERIRQADKIIHEQYADATYDAGFRVLKVDSSNMNDIYYNAEDLTQDLVAQTEDNIKSDRTSLDLLFGCLIDWGVPLSLPYTSETIDGCTVHDYADGALVACFDCDVPESVIRAIAERQPERAVFRDSSFADSPAKINVTEIFKLLSPDTDVRVL